MTDEVEPSERGHASIGEVLELLRAEFPDVTISKIRFLESQGLIEPERTASGYRKFYLPDVERLRWILRQQKDHYLPLRVIRGQLDDAHNPAADGTVSPSADGRRDAVEVAPVIRHPSAAIRVVTESVERRDLPSHARADRTSAVEFLRSGPTRDQSSSAIDAAPEAAPSAPFSPPPPPALMGVSMTLDELARASGLTLADIAQLEELGLVTARSVFSERYYDEEALLACRLAAGFLSHGVETRHLRMYKTAAEREAAFFEQVVTPLSAESCHRKLGDLELNLEQRNVQTDSFPIIVNVQHRDAVDIQQSA